MRAKTAASSSFIWQPSYVPGLTHGLERALPKNDRKTTTKELDQVSRSISSLLGQNKSWEAVAADLVAHLGPALGCSWVALWGAETEAGVLRVLATWHGTFVQPGELEDFTLRWQPSFGEGMVGKAWRTSRPQSSVDVVQDMALPRSLQAKAAGLVSGVWVPIPAGERGFVLECLCSSTKEVPPTAMLKKLAEAMTSFVRQKGPGA